MKPLATAAAALSLALLTFFLFPGHTWLWQDTQIYQPILEHLRDPSVLRNDILAQQPHVAFTLYDETAIFLRGATGLDFQQVLAFEQVVTRAFGIWGLVLIAGALGLPAGPAWLFAGICSLGTMVAGPQVLTVEYEATPRAFAVPLLVCAVGLASRRRFVAAGMAGAAAFLFHPPTSLPFWAVFLVILAMRRRPWGAAPLAVAAVIVFFAARSQAGAAEAQTLLASLGPMQERLQRMRAGYVWISEWPPARIAHPLLMFCILLGAFARVRRFASFEARLLLLGLPLVGLASMPASWLLLERWKWALVPQVQPLRTLLFVTLFAIVLCCAAGAWAARKGRLLESAAWFILALVPPVWPALAEPFPLRRVLVILPLGALAALAVKRAERLAPAVAVAALFAIPLLGGVVNYPRLHTQELARLSEWARSSTPQDAVFLFADAGRSYDPGIFRSEALRAVYVDWKGGGQVNYLKAFADEWWFRWQQTLGAGYHPTDLPRYEGLGVTHVVLRPQNRLPRPADFDNGKYLVYALR